MDLTVIQSSVALFEILCVIIVFASVLLQSRFFREITGHNPSWTTQIVLTVFFGLMSVFGTLSGLSIYGAVVNVRDLGPMAAGLICGPVIGIGSGIIGGLFRFAQGGPYMWTGLSAPILSGILGGIMYVANRRKFVPTWIAVLYIGLSETLISCYTLILVTKPAEFFTVVTTVAIPMIAFNVVGMTLFATFVHRTLGELEKHRVMQQLELEVESKRNLATVINTIPYPVYVLDREDHFTIVNDSLCRFIGRPREEIIARTPREFFSVNHAEIHGETVDDGFRSSISHEYEVTITKPDGQERTVISNSAPYTDVTGKAFLVGVIRDITDWKKMQDALAGSEAWYRTLFEHTGAATIIIEENGTIGQVNSEFVHLTRYSREEIEGKMSWKHLAHPDDLDTVRKYHRERLTNPASVPTGYTVRMRNRDGEIRTLHAVVAVIPGTKQSIASYVDVSEQKRSEEALTLVNKKLNLLSSITRHDIINQLMILKGYLVMLKRKTTDPAMLEYIGRSEDSTLNIERQILFTRDYQDMGLKAPAWQDVRSLVISAKGALPVGEITVEMEEPDVEVYADPLFGKVFYNLIDNSLKYGGTGMRTIRIIPEETAAGLSLVYTDDGKGIDGTDRAHLFEKGYGRHTGLGLFLSREILSITGISIEETGMQGSGARFMIRVPRSTYRIRNDRSHGQ